MKKWMALLPVVFWVTMAFAQKADTNRLVFVPSQKVLLAEASCGMCQFGLGGEDCKLAVRIKGKAYYVEGAGIDDFGDAHAQDGFCNAIRPVKLQGRVVGDRYRVSWLKVQPSAVRKKTKTKTKG
jgi:hypothetical protein